MNWRRPRRHWTWEEEEEEESEGKKEGREGGKKKKKKGTDGLNNGRGPNPFYRRTGVYLRGMKRMQRDSHQRLHRPQHPRHQDCFSHSASNSCFTVAVATVAAGP